MEKIIESKYTIMSNRRANVHTRQEQQFAPSSAVPGNSTQQMWHILNFHEQRLGQITAALRQMVELKTNYDVLASKHESLVEEINILKQSGPTFDDGITTAGVTLSVEE